MGNIQSQESRLNYLESMILLSYKTILNLDEVSDYTGFSKSTIYKKTSTGGIPCYKPQGKQIYFNKSEIDSWLLQNRKATISEIESQATNFVTFKKGGVL